MEKSNSDLGTRNNPNHNKHKKVFNFYELKNGSKISCHGKPTKSDIARLKKDYGVNTILTILYEKEQPELIKKYVDEIQDIKWIHLPLRGANMSLFMKPETQKMIINCILELFEFMKDNKIVLYIHCAAGVHRTGTILYTILRGTGETPETAMTAIKAIRIETHRNCGEHRIKYAEEFLVRPLLEALKNKNSDKK